MAISSKGQPDTLMVMGKPWDLTKPFPVRLYNGAVVQATFHTINVTWDGFDGPTYQIAWHAPGGLSGECRLRSKDLVGWDPDQPTPLPACHVWKGWTVSSKGWHSPPSPSLPEADLSQIEADLAKLPELPGVSGVTSTPQGVSLGLMPDGKLYDLSLKPTPKAIAALKKLMGKPTIEHFVQLKESLDAASAKIEDFDAAAKDKLQPLAALLKQRANELAFELVTYLANHPGSNPHGDSLGLKLHVNDPTGPTHYTLNISLEVDS